MMAKQYVVIKAFTDLQDDEHVYRAGDFYPRPNVKLDEVRADELASGKNARNEALIVEVVPYVDESYPKSVGGGYYLLSNGEKVQGKAKAEEAEQALQEK